VTIVAVGASGARPPAALLGRGPVSLTKRSLGSFVAGFKASVTRRIGRTSLWQRNYYEHVIRDEEDLHRVQAYIQENPRRWEDDEYYS
jgi:REP element-mobilizing transposase RayT